MTIKKTAHSVWKGTIKEGKGFISTESEALIEQPYGFNTRFEDKKGTNPEELIGAAHSGCFSMALSKFIEEAGLKPDLIDTKATVYLEKREAGFEVPRVHLDLKLQIPNSDEDTLKRLALKAKENCPISKLLTAEITLDINYL